MEVRAVVEGWRELCKKSAWEVVFDLALASVNWNSSGKFSVLTLHELLLSLEENVPFPSLCKFYICVPLKWL